MAGFTYPRLRRMLTVTFKPSFWQTYRASLFVLLRSPASIPSHLFFGGGGIAIVVLKRYVRHEWPTLSEWGLVAGCILFIPILPPQKVHGSASRARALLDCEPRKTRTLACRAVARKEAESDSWLAEP